MHCNFDRPVGGAFIKRYFDLLANEPPKTRLERLV